MAKISLEDLANLPPQQLSTITRQVETEIQFFSSSLKDLKTAVASFQRSEDAIKGAVEAGGGRKGFIPLTDTIFAKADFPEPEKFLIDIGTNYYAEMTSEEANSMFKRKREFVDKQIKTIESLLKDKQIVLAVAKESLKSKVNAAQQPTAAS